MIEFKDLKFDGVFEPNSASLKSVISKNTLETPNFLHLKRRNTIESPRHSKDPLLELKDFEKR